MISVKGLSPSKKQKRLLVLEREGQSIWLTIRPANSKSISSGYAIFLSEHEIQELFSALEIEASLKLTTSV